MAKSWVVEHLKLTEYQRKNSRKECYIALYSAAIIGTVISLKDI